MPIFVYRCSKCGKQSELLVPRFDSVPVCPGCGGTDMVKQPSAFSAGSGKVNACGCSGSCCGSADSCVAGGGCGCSCGCGGRH